MHSFEFTLAWRYFRSKRKHPFIGLTTNISVIGIALGVAALIVVLSVMSGFERDLIQRIVGTNSHAVIEGDQNILVSQDLINAIESTSGVLATNPAVEGQALLESSSISRGVLVKGSEAQGENAVSEVSQYLVYGQYPKEGYNQILIGDVLGRLMNLAVGDEVDLISPVTRKAISFEVSGYFHSGMYDYDSNLVYIPLDMAQQIYELGNKVSVISVKYGNPQLAILHQRVLQEKLGYSYYVRTWKDMNGALFGALKLEKIVMFIILTMIVLVACFNVLGSLTLLVMDKIRDIGTLKALGANGSQIRQVFYLVGIFISASGIVLGILLGLAICYVLKYHLFIDIPQDIYYFNHLPIDLRLEDVFLISGAALILGCLSTFYPAWRASNLSVTEAVRYE